MIEKVNTNGRQTGRTTELINKCAEYNYALIVCPNRAIAEYTFDMARDMMINIPMPITFKEFAEGLFEGRNIDAILIDNLEMVLNDMARGVPIAEVVLMDQGGYIRVERDLQELYPLQADV